MVKLQRIILPILLVMTISCAESQAQKLDMDTVEYDFETLSVSDGLPAGMVWNLEVDSRGILWITTTKGFVSYDGKHVKSFLPNSSIQFSIPDIEYVNIFIASNDLIWLSDHAGNLCLFDMKQERFFDIGKVGHPIKEFEDGSIWIRGKDRTFIVRREAISQLTQVSSKEGIQELVQSDFLERPQLNFTSKTISLGKYLYWFHEDTLYRIDGIKPIQKKSLKQITGGIQKDKKLQFVGDHEKNILYLFHNHRILKLSNWEDDFKPIATIPIGIGRADPWLVDHAGNIWITDNAIDIYRLSPHDLTITQIAKKKKSRIPLQNVQNRRLKQDCSGNIWIPTNGLGLKKYGGHRSKFRYFGIDHEGPIIGHLQTTDSDIIYWGRGTIEIYDIKKKRTIGRIDFGEHKPCPKPEDVFLFNEDQQQFELYFKCSDEPTYEKHIFSLFGQKMNAFSIEKETFDRQFLNISNRVTEKYLIELDGKNENKVGHDILSILDIKTNELISNYEIEKSLNWDISFSKETSEYLWILSVNKGILRYSIEEKKWDFYNSEDAEISALQKINFFLVDPQHKSQIWLATDKGLVRFDSESNTIQTFSNASHGFTNDVIYSIQVDDQGNFWMDTNDGLILFDPATETHRNFYFEDGLQHPEFNRAASAYHKGIMYFGGMGGLTYFDPNDFHKDTLSSDIVLNVLKVNNQEVSYNNTPSNATLSAPLSQNPSLSLDHDENMVTLGFNILDYNNPKAHSYQYRFKNRDDVWQYIGNTNELTFSNLSYGVYNFEVKGSNRNNQLSKNIASLNFTIKTPWWRTWWFTGLGVLFLGGLLYSFLKYRQKQKEKVVELRNRISQDLHDEIGSTLSSISLFGTVAKKLMDNDKDGSQQMLDRINDSTTEVMESMNDIVWAINSENDKVGNLAKRMRAFASELGDASDIKIILEIDEKLKDSSINMVQRRNVYLIYKEAINNAFKYSQASTIKVRLNQVQKRMLLTIMDDGIGFDKNDLDLSSTLGGNGLRNMENRSKELEGILKIDSKVGEGTEISFSWNPKFEPKLK